MNALAGIGVFLVLALVLCAARLWRTSGSRTKNVPAKSYLFSDAAEDITIRSADNLRLLSDAQLRAYELEQVDKD